MNIVFYSNVESIKFYLPEISVVFFALLYLALAAVRRNTTKVFTNANWSVAKLCIYLSLCAFLLFSLLLLPAWSGAHTFILFNGNILSDNFARLFQFFYILATLVVISMVAKDERIMNSSLEFYSILFFSVFGMFLMTQAVNLLILYLGVELVGLSSYILSGFYKGERKSAEASLKYVLYGACASGIMLFGISLFYGLTGSISYIELSRIATGKGIHHLYLFLPVILIFTGLFFKISAVPFHMWTPDVYEGAPISITAYLSVVPKAAGFTAIIRLIQYLHTIPEINHFNYALTLTLAVISAVSMTVGNLLALHQDNIKRLLAYSTIAHAGYILMGIVVFADLGKTAELGLNYVIFYLIVYLFMNIGAFLCIVVFGRENIDEYKGLGLLHPQIGVPFSVFLLSLAGIAPFAGFSGKFLIFASVIAQKHYWWLVVIALLNCVVSLWYYAKIIKNMFLLEGAREASKETSLPSGEYSPIKYLAIIYLFLCLTIILGVYFNPLLVIIKHT